MKIDTTNMCSHLQKKLFEENGIYHSLWIAMQDDPELTAVVRSRQLHIYRNGKKVLVLAGKSVPKIIREDSICELLQVERIKWMEQRFNNALAAIKDVSASSLKAIKEDVAELSKYYGSELWKLDFAADEAGNLPPKKEAMKKRKIKYSAIFFLCWFVLLVLLVDGVLKFQTLVDYFGSYALVEVALLLLVLLPTLAVYAFTKEKK